MWGHDEGERGIALHPAMLRSEVGHCPRLWSTFQPLTAKGSRFTVRSSRLAALLRAGRSIFSNGEQ
jgi:hypothetical protein